MQQFHPYLWKVDVGIYNYVSVHVLRSCGQDRGDNFQAILGMNTGTLV